MKKENIVHKQGNRYLVVILLMTLYIFDVYAQHEPDTMNIKIELDTLHAVPSLTMQSYEKDTAFLNTFYRENFKIKAPLVNIYDMPYSVSANYPNYKRLGLNTGVLASAGVVALGVLQLLPEDATAWNKKKIREVPFFKRWSRNVSKGPVWDKDNFMFNYILHPYGGAAYYMGARSQGFNLYYSFLYSAAVSTLIWEYGVESFMEIPSIQDLIVTPVAGTIIGEGFYILKRHIVVNDYRLFGSRFIGNVVVYLIDPVNEVIGIFAGNPSRNRSNTASASLTFTPWVGPSLSGTAYGFMVRATF